jgi:hypothetical protein
MRLRLASAVLGLGALVVVVAVFAFSGGNDQPSGLDESSRQAPTPTPTSVPTPATVDEAVLGAYLRYWQTYGDALYNLDTTRLAEVMTGPRLDRALAEVQSLKQQGRAVKISVRNRPVVAKIDGDTAVIVDRYENSSYFVNPSTKEATTQPRASETIQDSVTLTRVGNNWKVLDTMREVGQQ